MYTLIFIFVPAPLTLSHPTARSFCFLKLSVIKEQSIICQESQVLLQVFSGTPALTVRKNSWARTRSSGGGKKQTMQRAALAKPQEFVCVCVHMCACVLEDSRQICSGINMVCGYSLSTTLPRCFPGFGEQMIIGYTALE